MLSGNWGLFNVVCHSIIENGWKTHSSTIWTSFNQFFSHIYSLFYYQCTMVWFKIFRDLECCHSFMEMLFAMNNRSFCVPMFVRHEILALPCIHIYKILLFAKINEWKFTSFFFLYGYGTRNPYVLSVYKRNTSNFENPLMYLCMKLYNKFLNQCKLYWKKNVIMV